MATNQIVSSGPQNLLALPQEVKDRVYSNLFSSATIYVQQNTEDTTGDGIEIITQNVPYQITASSRQFRSETLSLLFASLLLWVNGDWLVNMNALEGKISKFFLHNIQHFRITGAATCPINLFHLPRLRLLELCGKAKVWVPNTAQECTRQLTAIQLLEKFLPAYDFCSLNLSHTRAMVGVAGGIFNRTFRVTISNVVYARLPSKVMMLNIRGVGPIPEQDDNDVTFENIFDLDTLRMVAGKALASRAMENMRARFASDAHVDLLLENKAAMSEGRLDEAEWEIDDWNNREGDLLVAEGRGWAWLEAVRETEEVFGPGL